eukprot:TRINITY_DN610_c0_g1_i1.p1 TRINITY_DN610_c0_g1~~TRINITY_DN610_c0_g1_i1.p1  ORF type:complete len:661 (+),score=145.66 TRINITY_DN610_c0_g1_i1:25-1983(+)
MLRSAINSIRRPPSIANPNLVPRRSVRSKVVSIEDAVDVVAPGDTITVNGFVGQGCPEGLLVALKKRFLETGKPRDLTLLFGGGPGDWKDRGLNHMAPKGLLRRGIGGHWGQVPMLAKLALNNEIEAYNLPLGSVSRMLRAQAAKAPGHLTSTGIGTFADPELGGGKINSITKEDIVESIHINGKRYLLYKALPVQIAFIRATTADEEGNLSVEHESLYGDTMNIAMACKNSGGLVIAQVQRIAARGSIPPRSVLVPGAMVDCVAVAKPEHHTMSYITDYNPAWSAEIKVPLDSLKPMPLDHRKIPARRGAIELASGQIVNLGVGMPEGVANVANEEKILQYLTLTTECGIFGGVGASGHDFGPASNYDAIVHMNQMFDFYNGGGLSITYLGMAQVTSKGDINVSKFGPRLAGAGGFIDIAQNTPKVIFIGNFTAGGLQVAVENGRLKIVKEGKEKKFIKEVEQVTFSGKQAVEKGQYVLYVTERCVFQLTPAGLELIEIAPGIDMQKDILDQMEWKPIINNPKLMDSRIFQHDSMELKNKLFALNIEDRLHWQASENTMYVDFHGLTIISLEDVKHIEKVLEANFSKIGAKFDMVANYDNFDCREEVIDAYTAMINKLQAKYYRTATRYSSSAFMRRKLVAGLHVSKTNVK